MTNVQTGVIGDQLFIWYYATLGNVQTSCIVRRHARQKLALEVPFEVINQNSLIKNTQSKFVLVYSYIILIMINQNSLMKNDLSKFINKLRSIKIH